MTRSRKSTPLNPTPRPRPAPRASSPGQQRLYAAAVAIALVLAVAAIYAQTLHYAFVNYDDDGYVYENPIVRHGLSAHGLAWAFTTNAQDNWHPLTWLTHEMDWSLYKDWAGGHHLTNLLLHALNAALFFVLLYRMTGALGRCAFAAALFALHPLRVESVAWIAERKDVLSTLFYLLTMAAHAYYARRPSLARMALTSLAMALGLMAKPTLVSLPFALLLLDYWPLGRCDFGPPPAAPGPPPNPVSWKRLLIEKTPLFALAALSCLITLKVQQSAMSPVSFAARVFNSMQSYVVYLAKTLFPVHLSVIYLFNPWAIHRLFLLGSLCTIFLAMATALALRHARRVPYVTVGWLWFLGTLVPMIGLVQVGKQSMADRYSYVPSIGLGILAAWGGWALASRWRVQRKTVVAGALALCCIWTVLAWRQTGYWANSITLFQHALEVSDTENLVARFHLGRALYDAGHPQAALDQYLIAWRLYSTNGPPIPALDEGRAALQKALAAKRAYNHPAQEVAELLTTMSQAYAVLGWKTEAMQLCQKALDLDPSAYKARANLGAGYCEMGQVDEGIRQLLQAEQTEPQYDITQVNLGWAYYLKNNDDEAIRRFKKALEINPSIPEAFMGLGQSYMRQKRFAEAAEQFRAALRLRPGDPRIEAALRQVQGGI